MTCNPPWALPPADPLHRDQAGQVRVILPQATAEEVFAAAFDPVRRHGSSSVAVMIRLLDTLGGIVPWARRPEERALILRHNEAVVNLSRAAVTRERDLAHIESAFRRVVLALEKSPLPV